MLERFYWWVGMEACAKWWIRRCLNCQARKPPAKRFAGIYSPSPCPTAPEYPSALTTLGPCRSLLEETPTSYSSRTASAGGQTCSLSPPRKSQLRYCQHLGKPLYSPVGMLINSSIRQRGLQFCAQLATAVCKLLGVHKLTTSAYYPSGNGGVEHVNHTMAQMLAMVCNEHQNDWDAHLTSNTPTITPLAPRQASLPMKYISVAYRASPSPSSVAPTAEPIRTRPPRLL